MAVASLAWFQSMRSIPLRICAPAAWFASRPRLVTHGRDEHGSKPPALSDLVADQRRYEAVHLACALHLEGDDILLATWVDALNAAARATARLIANDTD